MIILYIILALLILVCAIRISNNNDLIANNCKDENDLANINNAKKIFRKSKIYNYLLIIVFISIIVLIICAYTDFDYKLVDFISIELVNENDIVFDFNYFFLPIYLLAIREILIQVKIGEFLLKYFKTEEPKLEENPLNSIKGLLYKKPKDSKTSTTETLKSLENQSLSPKTPSDPPKVNSAESTNNTSNS